MAKLGLKEEKWKISEAPPKNYLKGSSFTDFEKKLLFSRGMKDEKEAEDFLNPKYDKLHDPYLMKGMKEAVERIKKALEAKEKVVIYGDYDVDGISATAVLYETFDSLGLSVGYYIPSRDEGYGINNEALQEIKKGGANLIVTVDCGASAVDEVEEAKKLGLDIIITDHHSIRVENGKDVLPEAVVINPKQKTCKYPYKNLSGSGIAFKLSQALYKEFPDKLLKGQEKWLLDLAVLGTVCDVVSLKGENRILAYFGIKVIQKTKRVGLKALAEAANIEIQEVDSYKIGFQLGPRLNAAGRLETAEKSIKLLLTKNESEARSLALDLNKLNQERQEMTKKIVGEAISEIQKKDEKAKIYLLKNKNWPAGIVGIIASRLADRYLRPVIVFEEREGECQGSARSPKCFNIVEALEKASEHLIRYGGHARAAGLTVKNEHFVLLENKLLEISEGEIDEDDLVPEYKIDSEISLEEINEKSYDFLEKLEPYGSGNSMPTFTTNNIKVDSFKKVGKDAEHLKLALTDGAEKKSGIFFSFTHEELDLSKNIDVVFAITKNVWAGRVNYEMRCLSVRGAK